MRFTVEYTYGAGSYGSRDFEAPANTSQAALERRAQEIIPSTAEAVISIKPCIHTPQEVTNVSSN